MPKRNVPDWLSAYLRYVENTEPPIQFHIWCALSTIAGVLQRRVWLDWERRLYPNLYVILVGDSGQTRKGTAIDKAEWFFTQMPQLNIENGNRVTKEQLAIDLASAESEFFYQEPGRRGKTMRTQHTLTHIVPELATFFGFKDHELLGWLTDWYDSKDVWENRTKTAGKDLIHNMCYNLLAATAPDWMRSMLPEAAVGGGFTSRVLFIYEERKRKVVSNPQLTEKDKELRTLLLSDLEQIYKLAGPMSLTPKAQLLYEEWYENQEEEIKEGRPPIRDERLKGYLARRQTHCLKLAMILSSSRSDELVIKDSDMRRAQVMLRDAEKKMAQAFGGTGAAMYAQGLHKIMVYLQERGTVTHSELLRQFKFDLSDWDLERIITNLRKMHMVTRRRPDEKEDADANMLLDVEYTWLSHDEDT